ncbi:hypothetical protein [Gemmatimonas sp.]|uniref:hypothetical protein n=1 Tax=Gemmatimonas sp. TaxID=1962908 RepID=UPI0025BE0DBB|nr:hypothetical protein [Gemmatimonas sp.]MCA2993075.1 hypothetical protein [Gemmatimonas sp.]
MTTSSSTELTVTGKLASGTRVVLDDHPDHSFRNRTALLTLEKDGVFDVVCLTDVGGTYLPKGTLTWTVANAPGEVNTDALRTDLLPGGPLHDVAARVVAGHSVEWDGHNWASHLTPDARDAFEEIDSFLSGDEGQYLTGREVVDADAWLYESACDELTGAEDDDALEALAGSWAAEAAHNGIVLVGDVRTLLRTIRDKKRGNSNVP